MAVPAPMVAGRARTPRHPPVHEPQGQLPGQRGDRAGLRPLEGRVLPRPCARLVRAVQGRAGRVHRPLEHQTTPDTTRGTYSEGIPEYVPHGLGLYPNKQRPTNGAQFNNRRGLHIDGCIQFVAKESSDACSIIEFVGTRFTMPFMLHDEASGADQRTQTENRTKNRSQRRNEHGSDNADDAGHQQYPEHQF